VSNLLVITDVARLQKIFGRLTEDATIRLRVVNNLEKGGEEIAIEKPDVVFVQTHLSGLSAEILLMHLKKQLGRKRSRFVLLAAPAQITDAVAKLYQGWLDTSAEDSQFFAELQMLLAILQGKSKKNEDTAPPPPEIAAPVVTPPQPVSIDETSSLLGRPQFIAPPPPNEPTFPVAAPPPLPEPSLEEQGITYAPRQRLKVYSEFNSSFDSAVSSAPEPEPLVQTPPPLVKEWIPEDIDTVEAKPPRSKRGTFLLWLVPVIVAVVVITYFQQQKAPPKPETTPAKAAPAAVKPVAPTPPAPAASPAVTAQSAPEPAKVPVVAAAPPPAAPKGQDKLGDKAVMSAIAENRGAKTPPPATPATPSAAKPTTLPDFIPRYAIDKQYGAANPGWERYKGQVTEFKVLREDKAIKAIQVIDRGGNGVPESFMKAALRQVAKTPVYTVDSSEKKEGYEVQRGTVSDNIRVVYYRDTDGGRLRAFVLTWR
jgi:hypothetical protein